MKFKTGKQRINRLSDYKSLLPNILCNFKLENSFTINGLMEEWVAIVGDIISTHSKPVRIFNKTLIIIVDHSIFANEIICMKDMILKRISDDFPFIMIKDIKTEIKRIYW
jgi:hypothetical protein